MPSKAFKEVGLDSQLVIVHFDPVVVGLLCMVTVTGIGLLFFRMKNK